MSRIFFRLSVDISTGGVFFWLGWFLWLGTPAGGGTFLFRQESTLRTPPGTLRGVGQGCDLVIAVGDHFPLSTVHSFSSSRHAACFVTGGDLGRAGPHVGRGPPQDDSVFFGWGCVFLAWVVSLAGHPAGGGTFLFRQESTQRSRLRGGAGVEPFWFGWSRGLGGPSRSRPPLRTPPGTLRGVGQGCDLVIAVGDHFQLSTVNCPLVLPLPARCASRYRVRVWELLFLIHPRRGYHTSSLFTIHSSLSLLLPVCCVFCH